MNLAVPIRNQILSRRETVEIYQKLNPKKTALVVIDMQKAFCDDGRILSVESAKAIIPNINRLAKAMRNAGSSVYWIQWSINTAVNCPVFLGDIISKTAVIDQIAADFNPSSNAWKLASDLEIESADVILRKDRFSAFLENHCDLISHLRTCDIDTVVITGTLSNICCESSARDAAMQNYKVIFVSDANAARSVAAHEMTLENIAQCFGDVRTSDEVLDLYKAHRQPWQLSYLK